jgi:MurNAc alpha-1-phosphate uridylyltransferase
MKAMILAAGRGSRMGALTEQRPKPLLEVGSESLIERHLRRMAAAEVREVVVNLCYGGEQIRARLGDGARWGLHIRYSVEAAPPLETGGAIVAALPLLGAEPFLLVNADVFTDFDFGRLGRGGEAPAASTLVLVDNPPHNPEGDFGMAGDGRLTVAPPRQTFAGISVLMPDLFDGCAPGRRALKPILDRAVERGALFGLHYEGLWLDVGTPERLYAARAAAAASFGRRSRIQR